MLITKPGLNSNYFFSRPGSIIATVVLAYRNETTPAYINSTLNIYVVTDCTNISCFDLSSIATIQSPYSV